MTESDCQLNQPARSTIAIVILLGCATVGCIGQDASPANRAEYRAHKLIGAAGDGDLEIVKQLLADGVAVDSKNKMGSTALPAAAFAGHLDIVQFLFSSGANIHGGALHSAAEGGHKEIVEFLIAKGANANANFGWGNPLNGAASSGKKEVVELLISNGADVNASTEAGRTPLRYAVWRSWKHPEAAFEVAQFLIKSGADVNKAANNGFTPLHEAALRGSEKIAELLINKGAYVNKQVTSDDNWNGMTPIDVANREKHTHITALLRKYGGKTGKELQREQD